MLHLGVTTRSFTGLSTAETAARMAAAGVRCTELCFSQTDCDFWRYNTAYDLPLPAGEIAGIAETYRASGIEVTALGVFANCLASEDGERAALTAHFKRHIEAAAHCGIPFVSTECGFFPGRRGVSPDRYESDFRQFSENLKTLCDLAERQNVSLALEPCVLDVVPSAKRARDLLDQIGSGRLKILLDPANLIANSSERDMFGYLAGRIAYFHGKDRKVNDAYGRLVGDGDIDWTLFLSLYREQADGTPFILEYCKADNFETILARARGYYGEG